MEGKTMNNEKAREILDHNWTRVVNPDYTEIELGRVQDTAIKALEVVEKIKNVYANAYKCLLGNLENGFTEEMATPVFYHDIAFGINNILSDAYDTDDKIWIKEIIDE